MFYSNIKGIKNSAAGNTVFRVVINQQKIESHAVPGHGIDPNSDSDESNADQGL